MNAAGAPAFLLGLTGFAIALHWWLGEAHPDEGAWLTAFTAIAYITLILAVHWLIFALIFVEAKDPTKPAEPEA